MLIKEEMFRKILELFIEKEESDEPIIGSVNPYYNPFEKTKGQMIVECTKNGVTVSNNSLDNQIADAEYYLLVAKLYGSKSTVNKWKRKIKKLKEEKEKEQNG